MTVSFVIPHWNRRSLLESALDSLQNLRVPDQTSVEILVADNGSEDGSAEAAEARGARVLRLGENRGVARALNVGIKEASGELVALINNDVELSEDWLTTLLEALQASGGWFATGKILSYNDHSSIDGAGDAICRGGASWRIGHGRRDGPLFDRPRKTYFPAATAALFRREFFDRVGLLDEAFFAYLEDVDLGLRAAIEDLPGVYVPAATALHRGSETAGAWSAPMVRWISRHQVLLLAKYYSAGLLLRFSRPILAAQLLWGAMAVSRGRGRAWLAGVVEGLGRARGVRRSNAALRAKAGGLERILRDGESEIVSCQRSTGFDAYWKWYCRLAWPPSEEAA